MVNKYWDLKDYSYGTMGASQVCYGVIEDPYPWPIVEM